MLSGWIAFGFMGKKNTCAHFRSIFALTNSLLELAAMSSLRVTAPDVLMKEGVLHFSCKQSQQDPDSPLRNSCCRLPWLGRTHSSWLQSKRNHLSIFRFSFLGYKRGGNVNSVSGRLQYPLGVDRLCSFIVYYRTVRTQSFIYMCMQSKKSCDGEEAPHLTLQY